MEQMVTLHRSTRIFVCIPVVLAVLLAVTSCAAGATPTPGAPQAATQPPSQTAPATAPATAPPPEGQTSTPTSQSVGTPAMSPGDVPRISLEDLKALIDAEADMVILDNRVKELYELEHIKGAISLPWKPQLTIGDLEIAGLEYVSPDMLIITY